MLIPGQVQYQKDTQQMKTPQNRLLASLAPEDLQQLDLTSADLTAGEVLERPGYRGFEYVYFPCTGIISLVVALKGGRLVETGMVGRDGVVGANAALDHSHLIARGVVSIGGTAFKATLDKVRLLADRRPSFRALLAQHAQMLLAEAQQSAACNATHTLEARMCRWLLRSRDLAGDDLPITQDFLAQMLSVRRVGVSLAARALQSAGIIRCARGHLIIVDVKQLREASCGCHKALRAHCDRMWP